MISDKGPYSEYGDYVYSEYQAGCEDGETAEDSAKIKVEPPPLDVVKVQQDYWDMGLFYPHFILDYDCDYDIWIEAFDVETEELVRKFKFEKETFDPDMCQYIISYDNQLKYFYHELEFMEYKAYYEDTERIAMMKVVIEHVEDPENNKYDGFMFFTNFAAALKNSFDDGTWFKNAYRQEYF